MPTQSDGSRWRNVPVPEPYVAGLLVGGALHFVRPWSMGIPRSVRVVASGALLAAGLALIAWAVLTAGHEALPAALVMRGPYRYSRNPMYVGWTGLYLGIGLLADATWLLALAPVVAALVHVVVRREERSLADRFGEDYQRYRETVPRYLGPPRSLNRPVRSGR